MPIIQEMDISVPVRIFQKSSCKNVQMILLITSDDGVRKHSQTIGETDNYHTSQNE